MSYHPEQLIHRARKLDQLNYVVETMQQGTPLHLEFRDGRERWCLANGCKVPAEIARRAIAIHPIVSDSDALFGCLAQTFRYAETHIQKGALAHDEARTTRR